MNILAIDSSSDTLSLALSAKKGIFQSEIYAGARHSELLMVLIDKLFEKAGLKPIDLDLAACMKGPGSFTGLRIGYAAVKGLSLALGIPAAAIPTLDCIASSNCSWPGIVLPVLDAKKNCFYAAFYRQGKRLKDYVDTEADTLFTMFCKLRDGSDEALLVTGNGAKLLDRETNALGGNIFIDPLYGKGRALEMIHFLKMPKTGKTIDNPEMLPFLEETGILIDGNRDNSAGPLYIRKSDAELNLIIKSKMEK